MAIALRAGALLNEASCFLCRGRRHQRLRSLAPSFRPPRGACPSGRSWNAAPVSRICTRAPAMATESYTFGPYKIQPSEVFYSTELSYAMVNLRPLVPGHVLVCPKREVKRFVDLTVNETSDLWVTAQNVGAQLECYHRASSLTFAIQDGPQAGQTVPHVHIHILPRKVGDFEKNDEIYELIDEKEQELKEKLDLDKERKDRSSEEMANEADEYRVLFS